MAEIKPCPFCGKGNIVICTTEDLYMSNDVSFGYFAVCDAIDGGCGAASGWQETEKEAIEAWNRRAGDAK